MMSDQQKQALTVLAEIWELSPDVRLGQLFAHLGFLGEVHLGRSLGYIDDDELMSILYKHRTELRARAEALQSSGLPSSVSGNSTVTEAAQAEL